MTTDPLVVYDAVVDIAFWQYVQAYFEDMPDFDLGRVGHTITIHIPKHNVIGQDAIRLFARYRDAILNQLDGVINHGAYENYC